MRFNDVGNDDLRFYQVIVRRLELWRVPCRSPGSGSQQDNFQIGGFRRVAQDVQHVKAADFRHHHVQQHQVGFIADSGGQSFFAVSHPADIEKPSACSLVM